MKSVYMIGFWRYLLLPCMLTGVAAADALTIDVKPVKLSNEQRASLKRFLADASPDLAFDWNSLAAHAASIDGRRNPISVTLRTVPALTAAGVCRSGQHHYSADAGQGRWQANDNLTTFHAWKPQGGDCAAVSSPIGVDKSLSDAEFLTVGRGSEALRARAAGVIGGSDCARVRFCEVSLRRINRVREESPPRVITKLTFTPVKPGLSCLYVMEVSFVGPLNDLVPLGASCPKP